MYLKLFALLVIIFVTVIVIASIILFYAVGMMSTYYYARGLSEIKRRTPILDARILGLIGRAEAIVQPDAPITYYSLNTYSEYTGAPWQFFINAFYHVEGVWPSKNRDVILINDVVLEHMSDEEILFIIGHELGHAKMDLQMRNNSFIFTNHIFWRNILYTLFDSDGVDEFLYEEFIEGEKEADQFGIECSNINAALSVLLTFEVTYALRELAPDHILERQSAILDGYLKEKE